MGRSWIILLGLFGIATSSLGFTVERSSPTLNSRNWSSPISRIDPRASIAQIFNDEFNAADVENILRDSDEKCSSSAEDSQRIRRSEEIFHTRNESSTIADKIQTESKESTIVSSSSETKNLGSTVAALPKETTSGKSKIVSSESTIASSTRETKTPEPVVVSSSENIINTNTSVAPIVASSEKIEAPNSTISSSTNEAATPGLPILSSPKETKINRTTSMEKIVDGKIWKNVVLLFVEDAEKERVPPLKDFEAALKFPVTGFLRSCPKETSSDFVDKRASLKSTVVPGKIDESCDCNFILREKISSLLSWARQVKDMTTGTISITNFSIPLPFAYENPTNQPSKDFEDNDALNEETLPSFKSEASIDLEKESIRAKRSAVSPSSGIVGTTNASTEQYANNGYDAKWDLFDMFARIRMAFIRILLESLGSLSGAGQLNGKRPYLAEPNFLELVNNSIMEIKSLPNERGFLLVVVTPGTESSAVIRLLQRETSSRDTLFIVSGICTSKNEIIPFFANGPDAQSLLNARVIWDLPESIRMAMTNECPEDNCENRHPAVDPVALPSPETMSPFRSVRRFVRPSKRIRPAEPATKRRPIKL